MNTLQNWNMLIRCIVLVCLLQGFCIAASCPAFGWPSLHDVIDVASSRFAIGLTAEMGDKLTVHPLFFTLFACHVELQQGVPQQRRLRHHPRIPQEFLKAHLEGHQLCV